MLEIIRVLKILFCTHKNKEYVYTLYGDAINHTPGRYVYRCTRCGANIHTQYKEL